MNSVGLLFVLLPVVFSTPPDSKTAEASTQTISPLTLTWEDMLNMEIVDYLRSGAFLIGFIATVWAGRETWLRADMILTGAFGVAAYFFPNALLSYETIGKLDAVHSYFAHCIGLTLLGACTTSYLSLKSRDEGVHASLLFSRFMTSLILLQAMGFDYMKAFDDNQRFSTQFISFGFFGNVLWAIGTLYYILKTPSFNLGSINLEDRLSRHLLFDVCLFMTVGLAYYAFPSVALSLFQGIRPDGIHAHLVRTLGAWSFGLSLHGFSALAFRDDADKRAVLGGRVVMYALVYPLAALYMWKYAIVTTQVSICSILFTFIPATNAALGFFIAGKLKGN